MAVGDAHVFRGFLTPVLTQLFFPKPPTTFPTCFCSGERRKYVGNKVLFNRGSPLQPSGHESDTLTTEPPGWGMKRWNDYIRMHIHTYWMEFSEREREREREGEGERWARLFWIEWQEQDVCLLHARVQLQFSYTARNNYSWRLLE